jgi:hypothetical protein
MKVPALPPTGLVVMLALLLVLPAVVAVVVLGALAAAFTSMAAPREGSLTNEMALLRPLDAAAAGEQVAEPATVSCAASWLFTRLLR